MEIMIYHCDSEARGPGLLLELELGPSDPGGLSESAEAEPAARDSSYQWTQYCRPPEASLLLRLGPGESHTAG